MRRLALAGALVAAAVTWMGASVAWGDSITPLCTIGQGAAQPCTGAWYQTPVYLSWTWSPLTSGTGSCQSAPYDSDVQVTVSCTVTWTDGFKGTQSYTIHVETSSPSATVAPARGPDSNGWYNHAVAGAINASSFSGIASCTSTTYSGAPTTSATVSGTCTDNAGKTVTVTSAPFAYDATPPTLAAAANPGDQSVAVSWQSGGDLAPIASIQVSRTGGANTASAAMVYDGTGSGFMDSHLKNGVHYTYTLTATDAAGNATVQTASATPGARLLSPAMAAHLSAPPMLSWTAVPGATYYNVQLFRADPRKVLSLWPKQASLQLHRTWRFDGRRHRLKPGKYRWYVWPGFGRRSAGRYGRVIGAGTFIVVR